MTTSKPNIELPNSPVGSPDSPGDARPVPLEPEPAYLTKFRRIERLVSLVAASKIHALFVAGAAGVGKTVTVLKALSAAGLREGEDFIVAKGHASPLGLYMTLFEHGGRTDKTSGGLVILDDCDGCLRQRDAANLLKALLDDKPTRTVSYLSSRLPAGVPTSFTYNGRVIFISNIRLGECRATDVQAIHSRVHYVEVYPTQRELLDFIQSHVVPNDYMGTTLNDRAYVFREFRCGLLNSAIKVNVRTFHQLLNLFVVDRGHFDLHLAELLPLSDDVRLLRRLLEHHMTVEDAASEFQILTGKSRSTFFMLKGKHREILGC